MEKLDLSLLKRILEIPGAPGNEGRIRTFLKDTLSPFADSTRIDAMGNLVFFKKGKDNPEQKRVMLSAHMDEISFIVTHIDDNGFLRFHTLGGFDPKTLSSLRVWVHGKKDLPGVMGCKPVHLIPAEKRGNAVQIGDFFIDVGMNKEEVQKWVRVGDTVTRQGDLFEMGNCLVSKSMDNRISVYVLAEFLRNLQYNALDVYAVFSVQEEVGIRGAQVASHQLNPHYSICIDTTIANDTPGASAYEKITELGKGVAIKVMDSQTICDVRMVEFLTNEASRSGIPYQMEVLTVGGTDTAAMQRAGKDGSIAGAISIPTRYIHQTVETVHSEDVLQSVRLLLASMETITKHDWNW